MALVLGFQKDLEQEVPAFIEKMTGIPMPDEYDSLITVLVVGVSLYALLLLVERVFKKRLEPSLVALRQILRATEINSRSLAKQRGLTPSQLIDAGDCA